MSDLFGHIPTIKAISLWQPWASLVAAHVKRHETRHWSTEYRGLLAIHAAKTLDRAGAPDELCEAVLGRPVAIALAAGHLLAAFLGQEGAVVEIDVVRVRERWPLPNVWLGVSVEDQARSEERIPVLLDTPAAVRWVSAEPLRSEIKFFDVGQTDRSGTQKATRFPVDSLRGEGWVNAGLDWVVVGGESGPGARPMHADWARQIRDDCATAGVPFFFKQMARKAAIPVDLQVRAFPDAR